MTVIRVARKINVNVKNIGKSSVLNEIMAVKAKIHEADNSIMNNLPVLNFLTAELFT